MNQVEVCMDGAMRDVCNPNSVGTLVPTRVICICRFPLPVEPRVNDLNPTSAMPVSSRRISSMQPPLRRHLSELNLSCPCPQQHHLALRCFLPGRCVHTRMPMVVLQPEVTVPDPVECMLKSEKLSNGPRLTADREADGSGLVKDPANGGRPCPRR